MRHLWKDHRVACPKVENGAECCAMSNKVALVKGIAVYQCTKHGRFELDMLGNVHWWERTPRGKWRRL